MRPNFALRTAEQANRRRLRVFLGTLTLGLALSLGFTWLRPAEYRSSALLEITPAAKSSGSAPVGASEAARPFLTEVQVLVSRPVLEMVATQVERGGLDLSAFGPDVISGMQSHIATIPVPSTNVVELVATGRQPEVLALLLNTIIDVYQGRLAEAYRTATTESIAQADEEVKKLDGSVVAKRRDVEAFRMRNNIVSLQRDENEVLARVRNLSTSLSTANDRVAAAEGKVRALRESAAAGKATVRARDDPTLANLEQRASQIREELRDLERGFTPDYMAKDPKVTTQRTRLAELERQISVQRAAGQQTTLLEAQEELAGAQSAAARLQNDMSTSRQEAGQFTARFNEYKSRQDELGELETAYRDAVQRRAKLEASELARMPTTKVVEAAATPLQPWRPLYWRDTAFSVGGSLVLALLAMWLVELFNRPEPQPAMVLIQTQPGGLSYEGVPYALPRQAAPVTSLEAAAPALLSQQPMLPRELRNDEVGALIRASDDDSRLVMLLLLSGLNLDEALDLRWSDIDLPAGLIHVNGASARDIVVNEALRELLAARHSASGADLLLGTPRLPATRDSIDAQILCAAHDAGITDATNVTSECLWHTYVSYLVRQGIRFADLTRLVGQLPAQIVGAYSALAPAGTRVGSAEVDLVHPALRKRNV